MDYRCRHRCAILFLGQNKTGDIRCVYHGWKFDTHGNCLEMPNLPPDQDFKQKVEAKAYRVTEACIHPTDVRVRGAGSA
jgi:phthalate 4,5-dioxygenase